MNKMEKLSKDEMLSVRGGSVPRIIAVVEWDDGTVTTTYQRSDGSRYNVTR